MTEKNKQATGGQGPGDASSPIQIVEADLRLPQHQDAVLAMVDAYSRDAMGEAKPLDPDVRARLVPGLQKHPTTLIFLAFDGDRPVGLRGKGVGRRLLKAIERKARELGCCKLTLEVMDNNHRALRMYEAAGFVRYALQKEAGTAIFMSKPLH